MIEKITLEMGADKTCLFEKYLPQARFEIPSELRTNAYVRWANDLVSDFVRSLSSHRSNEIAAMRGDFFREVAQEAGIAGIYIGDQYFDYCKLYVYDGERGFPREWKGILLRNHFDMRSRVAPLYLLAEKLEEFLQKRGIAYTRFGRKIGCPEECEQVTPVK